MCPDEIQAKVKGGTDFQAKVIDKINVLKLLQEIRKIMFNFQDKRCVVQNYFAIPKKHCKIAQGNHFECGLDVPTKTDHLGNSVACFEVYHAYAHCGVYTW